LKKYFLNINILFACKISLTTQTTFANNIFQNIALNYKSKQISSKVSKQRKQRKCPRGAPPICSEPFIQRDGVALGVLPVKARLLCNPQFRLHHLYFKSRDTTPQEKHTTKKLISKNSTNVFSKFLDQNENDKKNKNE